MYRIGPNLLLAGYYSQRSADCKSDCYAAFTQAQLVARNKLRATRNLLRATSIKLRATCCAGVNAA